MRVTPWPQEAAPTEAELLSRLREQGLNAYPWSNGPLEKYAPHAHTYDKVIYVVRGAITFGLPDLGCSFELGAGDRLDLPAGTVHDARVSPQGVTCLEAHRD